MGPRMVVKQLRNRPRQTSNLLSNTFMFSSRLLPTSIIYPPTLFRFSCLIKRIRGAFVNFRQTHLYGQPPPPRSPRHVINRQSKSDFVNLAIFQHSETGGRGGGGSLSEILGHMTPFWPRGGVCPSARGGRFHSFNTTLHHDRKHHPYIISA